MSSLYDRAVNNTYKNILQIDNSNAGVDGTLRDVEDGEGTVSALQLSTSAARIDGTLEVTGASTFTGGVTFSSTLTYNSFTFSIGGNFSTGGAFTMSGAHAFTGTLSAPTTVTFPTSGTLSTLTGTETLTNKTITSPKINQILDNNGNEALIVSTVASAVNEATLTNAITGQYPKLIASGSDTNINFGIQSKGTGSFFLLSENTTTPFVIFSGTSQQHQSNFIFANTAANRNITFQDSNHTVVGRDTTDTLTNKTLVAPALGVATATSINFGGGALSTYIPWTSFAPTVTSSNGGDTIPVYSTNLGYYTRIGDIVTVHIELSGDGGAEGNGAGTLRIALPVTTNTTQANTLISAGVRLNGTAYFPTYVQSVGNLNYCTLVYLDPATNTVVQITPSLQNNTSRSILLAFSYRA